MESMDLWDEFSFLETADKQDEWSLESWCNSHGERGELLAKEWDMDKNSDEAGNPLSIKDIGHNRTRLKFWWKCSRCGKEFKQEIRERTQRGHDCPVCARNCTKRKCTDTRVNIPIKGRSLMDWCNNNQKGELILREWDYEMNFDELGNPISPKDVFRGSGKKVWWKCYRCGNKYQLPIRNRVSYSVGCSKCRTKGTSYSEQFIFYGLQQYFPDAENRVKVDGKMEFDIVIPSINTYIEYSGEFWHTEYSKKDYLKRDYCKDKGIRFIEIIEKKKYIPITVDNDTIIYKFNQARQDETLWQVLMKVYELLGYSNVNIDYNEIVMKSSDRMLRPIDNNIMVKYKCIGDEWDIELNNGAKPEYFSSGSSKRIIWRCTKCSATWSSTIANRIEFKTGCPYCRYNIFSQTYKAVWRTKYRRICFGKNNI